MRDEELSNIYGGATKSTTISATMLNTVIRGISLVFELGKSFGSSIRRTRSSSYCN